MMLYSLCRRILVVAFLLLMLLPGIAHAEAGHFLFVHGKVTVTDSNGAVRSAAKGMIIQEGDTIASSLSGTAQMRMKDGAFLALRPNTTMRLDAYAYKDKGRKTQSTISLLKGTFRAISGKIGKLHPKNDLVKTPVATIGIRGTDHEPAYIPPPLPGMKADTPTGAYDKVNNGSTYIQTNAGRINLSSNQIGYAAALDKAPIILPVMPSFYRASGNRAFQKKKARESKNGIARGNKSRRNKAKINGSGINGGSRINGNRGGAPGISMPRPVQSIGARSGSGSVVDLTRQRMINKDGTITKLRLLRKQQETTTTTQPLQ